ncbi:MAG: ATP-binding protein, partial [Selenomonadaceae bacterium]|nr:ATP-binding protein [Selenomonadaceae bacterium]
DPEASPQNFTNYGDRLFFYVFDEDNRLLDFSRASYKFEFFILDHIRNWDSTQGEVQVFNRPNEGGRITSIMITARTINAGGVGHTVFVGKDVTTLYSGLQKTTYLLLLIGFVALMGMTALAYFMAGRALIPLVEAYEKQKQFAADASHELRTPLAVVMSSAELLLLDQSITSPFLRQIIEDVKSEVKKMSKLVSDLLIVARSDNNALKMQWKTLNLGELLNQNVRIMRPLAQKKDINLLAEGIVDVKVRADEQKLKQVILILVDNAIKYTPEGGTVMVRFDGVFEAMARFSIIDTGIGIAPEDLDRVFERFYRVDKARSREMGGNGLGLSIAHEMVRLHEGNIKVESVVDQGTKFTVEIPVKK